MDNGDGCTDQCTIEKGWYCDEEDLTTMKSTCFTRCGDAMMVAAREQCDDGNIDDLDGCSSTCHIEPGYICYDGSVDRPSKCTCEPLNSTTTFTDDWEGIIITYPREIDYVNKSLANNSSELCEELFSRQAVSKFGNEFRCSVEGTKILVSLGWYHQLDVGVVLTMNPGTIVRKDCLQQHTNQLELDHLIVWGNFNHIPTFTIEGNSSIKICDSFSWSLKNIDFIGKREITIVWELVSMGTPFDSKIQNNIKSFLAGKNATEITFPQLLFLPTNTYIIMVTITPFWGNSVTQTKRITPASSMVLRDPSIAEICTPPRNFDLTTIPSQRTSLLLKFDRKILNSTQEVRSILMITIGPDYSQSDFTYRIERIDQATFKILFDYRESIYQQEATVMIENKWTLLDIYGNSYIGPDTKSVALLDYDVYSDTQQENAKRAGSTATMGLVSTIIPIVAFGSGPLILSFLNGAQVVNYMRYINIYYPINAASFIEGFNNVDFGFFPNFFESFASTFDLSIKIEDQTAPFQFSTCGINSMFLINGGSIYGLFCLLVLGHYTLKFLVKIPFGRKFISKLLLKLLSLMEYMGYLVFLDSTYYQQSFAVFLQLQNISFSNRWNVLSFIACLIHFIPYLGYPITCYIVLNKDCAIYYTRHSALMRKFGCLCDELDTKRKVSRMFLLFTLARRVVHVVILVFAHDSFYTEIFLLILMNIAYLVCLLIIRPYNTPARLKKEIFGEILVLFVHSSIAFIKIFEKNTNTKYQLGWVVAAGCSGIIGMYLWEGVIMCYDKIKFLLLKLKERRKPNKFSRKLSLTLTKPRDLTLYRATSLRPKKKKFQTG